VLVIVAALATIVGLGQLRAVRESEITSATIAIVVLSNLRHCAPPEG
jgi:hypothetical protein